MWRFEWGACLALVSLAAVWPLAAAAAELPTAEEILKTYQRNKERLSQLHVQSVYVFETTEANAQAARDGAARIEAHEKALQELKPEGLEVEVNGKTLRGAKALAYMKRGSGPERLRSAAMLRTAKPFRTIEPMEFFVDGQHYQRRKLVQARRGNAQLKAWRFPTEPLTPQSLSTAYRAVEIFRACRKRTRPCESGPGRINRPTSANCTSTTR